MLSDHERRAVYDRYGHEGLRTRRLAAGVGGFGNISDIFEAFFGGGDPFGVGVRRPRRGPGRSAGATSRCRCR